VTGRALQFVLQLILGRVLGPAAYGVYSLAYAIVEVVKQFGLLGMQNGVVRIGAIHLTDEDHGAVRSCARATYRTALLSSAALAAVLWIAAGPLSAAMLHRDVLVWPIRVFALSMPFDAWLILSEFWSRALKRVELDVLLADIAQPGLSILAVAAALALGTGVVGAVAGYGVACVLGAALGVFLLARTIRRLPAASPRPYDMRRLLRTSIPMLLVGFSYILMGHVDKVMIGAMVGAEAAGVYTAAFRMSRQIGLIQTAFVPMFAPLVSGLHHRRNLDDLARLYRQASRWILITSLPVVMLLTVFGDLPMALFGRDFSAAWPLLVVLAFGQFLNLAGGLAMQVLQMVGRQDDDLVIITGGLLANVALNLWLVRTHGALGAAVATTTAFAALSLARLFVVRARVGIWPYARDTVRPLAIAAGTGLAGWTLRGATTGVAGEIGALAATLALFAGAMWFGGLKATDRALLRRAAGRVLARCDRRDRRDRRRDG
jgi:O-antigen/teichoic acid export membrane protein